MAPIDDYRLRLAEAAAHLEQAAGIGPSIMVTPELLRAVSWLLGSLSDYATVSPPPAVPCGNPGCDCPASAAETLARIVLRD